jgi:hypothetical protein
MHLDDHFLSHYYQRYTFIPCNIVKISPVITKANKRSPFLKTISRFYF